MEAGSVCVGRYMCTSTYTEYKAPNPGTCAEHNVLRMETYLAGVALGENGESQQSRRKLRSIIPARPFFSLV